MEPSSWGQVCVLGVGEGGSLGLTLDFLSTPLWLQRHLNAQPPPPGSGDHSGKITKV